MCWLKQVRYCLQVKLACIYRVFDDVTSNNGSATGRKSVPSTKVPHNLGSSQWLRDCEAQLGPLQKHQGNTQFIHLLNLNRKNRSSFEKNLLLKGSLAMMGDIVYNGSDSPSLLKALTRKLYSWPGTRLRTSISGSLVVPTRNHMPVSASNFSTL